MAGNSGRYAAELRRELAARARLWAATRPHVESYSAQPVIVFPPAEEAIRHGNFHDPAYAAIAAQPAWLRRFDKIHAQGRALPKHESGRRWRELDSSMSSDALLMNIFCAPGIACSAAVRRALGIEGHAMPEFGWKARVPLSLTLKSRSAKAAAKPRYDRTEVDMRWGSLLVEAKLTESDFQTRSAAIVHAYRDFDEVFDRDRLPRIELRQARRRTAVEFAEEFTQEWEPPAEDDSIAREFQQNLVAEARAAEPFEPAYVGYQLIRNVLAAHAEQASFCVLHDARRPDLREQWFQVISAVKTADMRTRCQVMTWQELSALLPEDLQQFLDVKYGIAAVGQ